MSDSNGLYYVSTLHITDLRTGKAEVTTKLDDADFAEGIVIVGPYLYQLTYVKRIVYVYDKDTLEKKMQLELPPGIADGWGMTTDGTWLIMSDGTDFLHWVNPDVRNFTRRSSLRVRKDRWSTISNLNELEFIEGYVWANEFLTDNIWVIDPDNGTAVARLTATSLKDRLNTANFEVTNGIAWTYHDNDVLLTGKKWDKIFRVSVSNLPRRMRISSPFPGDTCFESVSSPDLAAPTKPMSVATVIPRGGSSGGFSFGGLGRLTPPPPISTATATTATTTSPPATGKRPRTTRKPVRTTPRGPSASTVAPPVRVVVPTATPHMDTATPSVPTNTPADTPSVPTTTVPAGTSAPAPVDTCARAGGQNNCGGMGSGSGSGTGTDTGGSRCWCDLSCVSKQDCCSDFVSTCVASSTRVPPPPVNRPAPSNLTNTCVGWNGASLCGTVGLSGACWCDLVCLQNQDCCSDFAPTCLANVPPRPSTSSAVPVAMPMPPAPVVLNYPTARPGQLSDLVPISIPARSPASFGMAQSFQSTFQPFRPQTPSVAAPIGQSGLSSFPSNFPSNPQAPLPPVQTVQQQQPNGFNTPSFQSPSFPTSFQQSSFPQPGFQSSFSQSLPARSPGFNVASSTSSASSLPQLQGLFLSTSYPLSTSISSFSNPGVNSFSNPSINSFSNPGVSSLSNPGISTFSNPTFRGFT